MLSPRTIGLRRLAAIALIAPMLVISCSSKDSARENAANILVDASSPDATMPEAAAADATVPEDASDATLVVDANSVTDSGCDGDACALSCTGGTVRCGDRCVDTQLDPAHCGGCNLGCDGGSVCSNGNCALTCVGGTTRCNDRCVDMTTDPKNCGACNSTCVGGSVCSNGVCSLSCGPGTQLCGGRCVDVSVDTRNCGSCGAACGLGQPCIAGHCGDCGNVNQVHCGPTNCVDLMTDPNNCGACGYQCSTDAFCTNGKCGCGPGKAACDYVCVDVLANNDHCGVCGVACDDGEQCVDGACKCDPNASVCAGKCTWKNTSSLHCGSCSSPCGLGSVCTAGVCAAAAAPWSLSGGNERRSGANALETGHPPATPAWSKRVSLGAYTFTQVSVVGGRACFVASGNPPSAECVNASDGSSLWKTEIASYLYGSAPTLANGALFVWVSGANGAALKKLSLLDGSEQWSAPIVSNGFSTPSPVVFNGVVYATEPSYGHLLAFDEASGVAKYTAPESLNTNAGAPSIFGADAYVHGDAIVAVKRADGSVDWSLLLPTASTGYVSEFPVFSDTLGYVVQGNKLHAFDPVANTIKWSAPGYYKTTPAVSGGAVFAISSGNLVVRDAATGTLQWAFAGDNALWGSPVVANGYVYVSSNANVYAVNVASHAQAWTSHTGGFLTIGHHRLFVSGQNSVTAFALTP